MSDTPPKIELELDFDFINPEWDFVITLTNRTNLSFDPEVAKAHHSLKVTEIVKEILDKQRLNASGQGVKFFWRDFIKALHHQYTNDAALGLIYVPSRTTVTISGCINMLLMNCECDIQSEVLPMGLHLVK